MSRRLTGASVLMLVASIHAQGSVTSPRGFDHLEGADACYSFGQYPAGRFMSFDGEQTGAPMTLKGVAFRADNRDYAAGQGMGRAWTNVRLRVSECDLTKLVSAFDNNPTTTPTAVFDKAVNLPTLAGKPPKFPADWSFDFPFSSNWSYGGAAGICLDFVFAGGTLANGGAWASSTASYYYLDSVESSGYQTQNSTPLGLSGQNVGCNDRKVSHTYGASVTSTGTFYSDTYSTANYAGRLVFQQTGSYFGESTPVVTLLGFRSLFAGVQFPGVYCNNLHVDTSLPTVVFPGFSAGNGSLPALTIGGQYGVAAPASASGAEIVTQAAWSDTLTGQLLLSSAARFVIPVKPRSFVNKMLSSYNSSSTTGSGPYAGAAYNPIARYAR